MEAETEFDPANNPSFKFPLTVVVYPLTSRPICPGFHSMCTFFANSKLCLHLPTGRGSSGGCTMLTSFLSLAMKKPVRKNLAMTGVLTLEGKVLQIGSVKEKTIGATQSQVKMIIFPEANRRDFDKLEDNVKQGLDVHFVHEYEQIFELAFGYDHYPL